MLEPCTLPCYHRYCINCLKIELIKQSKDHKNKASFCPFDKCGKPLGEDFKIEIDTQFQKVVRLNYPKYFYEWSNIVNKSDGMTLKGDMVTITLNFGNEHEINE